MTSTAPGAHPPPEEVDTLLDPSGGDAQVAAHVDTCRRCHQVREDLRAVRALLGAQARELPPEPPDLGARIAAALAAEPPLRPAVPGGAADAAADASTSAAGTTAGGWERSDGGQVVALPTRRRRWPAYLAVAASVAVVGIGGAVLVDGLRSSGSASSAGAAAEAPQESAVDGSGGSAPGVTSLPPGSVPSSTDKGTDEGGDAGVRASGTDYTRAGLADQAQALLTASSGGLGVQGDDGAAAFDDSTRASCLAGVGRAGADPVATDVATFEGEPATVLVLASSPGHEVLVVPAACGRGDDRVLASASLR